MSCDEAIIKKLDDDSKIAYGDTLLNAVKTMGNYNDKLAAVTLSEGAGQIKERLDAIMKFKKRGKAAAGITLALTVILCICAIVTGAYVNRDSVTTIDLDGKSSAYTIVAQLSKIDMDLSIAEYTAKVVKICADAGTDVFSVMADAQITSPNDPLYSYSTDILAYISGDLLSDEHITDEQSFLDAYAQWNGAKTGETIIDDFDNHIDVLVSHQQIDYFVFYELSDKTKMTVAEREQIFDAIKDEMQSYVNSLSEAIVFSDSLQQLFEDKLQLVIADNSTENLSLNGNVSNISGYRN